MKSNENTLQQIQLLQENLCSLRKIAGWTTNQLGEKIGVTKQTISNLENRKSTMNLTQYIAIRAIFDYAIEQNRDDFVLARAIDILIDHGSNLEHSSYLNIKDAIDTVAASAATGKSSKTLEKTLVTLLSTPQCLGILAALGIGAMHGAPAIGIVNGTAKWLKKIIR